MTTHRLRFRQLDVFSAEPFGGNPLAVVAGADGMDDAAMQRFARWTNLSETTFLLEPTPEGRAGGADYRVRIFTPEEELPFAGHPTLGTAAAWAMDHRPEGDGLIVQECGIGLVKVRRNADTLAFAAPPLRRYGPVEPALMDRLLRAFGLDAAEVEASSWLDNGPNWVGLLVRSRERLLSLRPDLRGLGDVKPGLAARCEGEHGADDVRLEVRAFVPGSAVPEDPVTGSLNAGMAQWLMESGRMPDSYVAAQGTVLGRSGRVHAGRDPDGTVWIGGACRCRIEGWMEP
ncbi:PhzF family phenazine biosynthesis protein [Rhizosaccharibacter radicis]|uniref:PhzF family phenazine biosynthesis protein n=1 Tax=Rhizosaccharibacter radicis TaxID=2782605 RepID=A0ABT1VV05_9PROT|nr:PhzF family phenazine biosynthesis protein [Acetobacteraceae bacterium KSS12]